MFIKLGLKTKKIEFFIFGAVWEGDKRLYPSPEMQCPSHRVYM